MIPDTAIALDDVRCSLAGRTVLDLPHLHIAHGERVALVGANGAGKTTLMRCLGGFVPPAAGHVRVLGHTLSSLPDATQAPTLQALRRELGQVMQGLHLVGRLTARENVLIGLLGQRSGWRTWARLPLAADVARAEGLLQSFGLAARSATRTDRLSGGERQKVALARVLIQQPRLILADEPTASLDPAAALEACHQLVKATAGATLLTVVHTPSLLTVLADRVIGLRAGRVAWDLPIDRVSAGTLATLYDGAAPVGLTPEAGRPMPAPANAIGLQWT